MNFFQAQENARKRTQLLVGLFAAAVLAIIGTLYALAHITVGPGLGRSINPILFLSVAAGVLLLVGFGSAYRTIQLRRGGPAVAELLGGRRVAPDTTDPAERRLVNVVEEMAIASGTPVPAIYILDDEPGLNAFAAGHSIDDAAVAVTRGTLDRMTRDELQGVIAHEFSHILNGDMRLNIRLMGLLFGILLIAVIGRGLMRVGAGSSRNRRNGRGDARIAVIGLVLFIVGYIGVFFGRLIQAAISRQREFLADAAAVQFTRNPAGIANALKKIGGIPNGARLSSAHAVEASHLFFASTGRFSLTSLLATHPPLPERIRRIDPSFDGSFEISPPRAERGAVPKAADPMTLGRAGTEAPRTAETRHRVAGTSAGMGAIGAAALLSSVGTPTAHHVAYAARLIDELPAELLRAARRADDAPALLFALLQARAGTAAKLTADPIRGFGGEEILARTQELVSQVRDQDAAARLVLLELALPTIRTLPEEKARALTAAVQAVIRADNKIDLFEYAVYRGLLRKLDRSAAPTAATTVHSLKPLRAELEIVLSALAHAGTANEIAAEAAFTAATKGLPEAVRGIRLQRRSTTTVAAVDRALSRLATAAPGVRQRILEACVQVITDDGVIRPGEAELLRAIGSALDCPVPPLLPQAVAS